MITIKSLVIGVRITPVFQLADSAGMIFDKLLKDTKAFPRKVYSRVQYGNLEKLLYEDSNEEISNYIKISSENVIFSQKVGNEKNILEMVDTVKKKFEKYIVPITLDEYNTAINRIGIVFVTDIDEEGLKEFKKRYFAKGLDVAEFRFSRSAGLLSGAVFEEGADYSNRIFTYAKKEESLGRLTFDYQHFFIPLRPNWMDCKPDGFFDAAIKEYNKDILSE